MSLYDIQGVPMETDCQVINKEYSKDVPGNARGQLIQSKTCHGQDTTSWYTFLYGNGPCIVHTYTGQPVAGTGRLELWIQDN